jgi:SAM-dependent methyltransferase
MSSTLEELVRDRYARMAESGLSSRDAGVAAVARAFGYSAAELAAIPEGANMGLSCGNPTAFASLRPGEVVVDLGCGGGMDLFLAAAKVGPAGKAIGIDMTPEMIELARRNAAAAASGRGITNVEFHLAKIDRLPLANHSVDCVISNCVINLAPDKAAVFREIFRVLRPGGRLAVSDIALKQALPEELSGDLMAYVGCIAGAISIEEYQRQLAAAGFDQACVVDAGADLNAYALVENQAACCAPPAAGMLPVIEGGCAPAAAPADAALHARLKELLARHNVNDFAASVRVYALKPGGSALEAGQIVAERLEAERY